MFSSITTSEKLPAERLGKRQIPLCMNQNRMQFGVTRVPAAGCDKILQTFPARAKHIVVLAEDQIFRVEVVGAEGEVLTVAKLERLV